MTNIFSALWSRYFLDDHHHPSSSTSTTASYVELMSIIGLSSVAAVAGSYLIYRSIQTRRTREQASNGPFTISEINIYPVKALRGMSVQEWPIGERGFLFDRQWVIVTKNVTNTTDAQYQFISQRQLPRLCLLGARVDPDEKTVTLYKVDGSDEFVLNFDEAEKNAIKVTTEVWKKKFDTLDMGDGVAEWLSKACDKEGLRLIMAPQDLDRKPDEQSYEKFVKELSSVGEYPMVQTSFPDWFPYLMTTENSLADLNSKLEQQNKKRATMSRFRPNIVIGVNDSLKPFEEEYWKHIQISAPKSSLVETTDTNDDNEKKDQCIIEFFNCQLCGRCSVPNIDPETANREETGPSYQLLQYHKSTANSFPLFGILLVNSNKSLNMKVKVGGQVTVAARHEFRPTGLL